MEKTLDKLPDRTQGDLKGGYFWQEELVFGQCDGNLQLRLAGILEQLVNSATQHCRRYGMSYETLRTDDIAFVLTRTSITIHTLPHCFQLLTIKTWMDGTKGPFYQRVTQWLNQEGEVMVSGRSDWVTIQPSTRSLVKPDKEDLRFQHASPVSLPPCQRVKWNKEKLEFLGEYQIKWSEIDGNGHLHSSNYGDIIWNFLPPSLQDVRTEAFHMEFQKECCLGDILHISGATLSDGSFAMEGVCQEQISFKAKIIFKTP